MCFAEKSTKDFLKVVGNNLHSKVSVILTYNLQCYFLFHEYEPLTAILFYFDSNYIFHFLNLRLFPQFYLYKV